MTKEIKNTRKETILNNCNHHFSDQIKEENNSVGIDRPFREMIKCQYKREETLMATKLHIMINSPVLPT